MHNYVIVVAEWDNGCMLAVTIETIGATAARLVAVILTFTYS